MGTHRSSFYRYARKVLNMIAEDYFQNLAEFRKKELSKLRHLVHSIYPDIIENMDYKLPTYIHNKHTLCAMASQKNYMALYIMPHDLLDHFKEELKGYNLGKSCIRFKELGEDDINLFKNILTYCGQNHSQSRFYGKKPTK